MSQTQKLYYVEELFRGEFVRIKIKATGKDKTVKISEDSAEMMNRDTKSTGVRYVLVNIAEIPEKPIGPGVIEEFNVAKARKPELLEKAKELGFDVSDENTVKELKELILSK